MRESIDEMVRAAVARHLEVAFATITSRTHLQRDLELDPLDLVLIALRIEDTLATEFPIAHLEGASTVGDLISIVRTMRAASTTGTAFTLDAPRFKLAVGG